MNEHHDAERDRLRAGPDALAEVCVTQAARSGFTIALTTDTPVVPDARHPWLTARGTWGDIETLVRHWTVTGCGWVNLRFGIDGLGMAIVRYEARPEGGPLIPAGRLPAFNGGFDIPKPPIEPPPE